MESATIRRAPPLPGLIQLGLIGLLVAFAAVAWVLTSDQMSGMDAGPGTDPGTLGFFIGVWVVMMAAMMFPSIAPMVLMHVRIQEGRRERGQAASRSARPRCSSAATWSSWAAAGLVGYGIYRARPGRRPATPSHGTTPALTWPAASSSRPPSTSSPR